MANMVRMIVFFLCALVVCSACTAHPAPAGRSGAQLPRQIIDLSPTITEDLPVRLWGRRALKDFGFTETTQFRLVQRSEPTYVSNAYWTLMNHAGPHVDAPNHLERGAAGADSYRLESLVGPIKLVDLRGAADQPIAVGELKSRGIQAGDVVIAFVGYVPPTNPEEIPAFRALSKEAAEYLTQIPIKAFATDALSVDSFREIYERMGKGMKGYETLAPVHHAFLTQGIPAVEQLTNVDALIGVAEAVFVGLPLKVKDADGAPMRAAAFVY
jgi:kynurenine formamidase